ncbi:nucleotide sugar dehydrogenase [Desulfosporosinus orientis DSM 765]|uniref:UDP-glucose 6-dehydrogenase n=1 Tax=Desulfosporosinus orientis (strain ATCC 19365 / DSM 765 / NCIMB 8382 / VKM B-1628 / Singapore I) TaxID=768706 RepID=G7WAZ0_DESOD|nr:UDP-glucose/GDP-mannose dehydrogenase family protein [Desulfosporosinus orientis]AET67491.1 nucleotide sugar dehydrogenase [Desulfosporosinus orientis DSM 765]
MIKICVVGAGYVGLTTSAALAEFGNEVQCVDIEQSKINMLNQGLIPIYEPGLGELIQKNVQQGKLHFSFDVKDSIKNNSIILIAVGTPPKEDGSSDLSYINNIVDTIVSTIQDYKIVITKSTVPPGTNEWIHQIFLDMGIDETMFDIVSNPEFLREGMALWDIFHPNKIVFGTKTNRPIKVLKKLYEGGRAPLIFTSLTGAEMIKYASNAFLATKISFANEIARICDAYNVEYLDVAKGLGTDSRIGRHFLNAGLGFGGSCLPKDLSSLKHSALRKNVDTKLLDAVLEVNDSQIELYLKKLNTLLPDLAGKKITVWGVTFKPNTDDLRFSPSIALINELINKGARVHTYDPIVQLQLPSTCSHTDQYESISNSDALIIATEWEQFCDSNWADVKSRMSRSIILDARNCLDGETIRKNGLVYLGVGKQ